MLQLVTKHSNFIRTKNIYIEMLLIYNHIVKLFSIFDNLIIIWCNPGSFNKFMLNILQNDALV